MTRGLCAVAVVCFGGLAAGVSPAFGAFPGENGRILFESFRAGGDERDIWTISPQGRKPLNLTADSAAFDGNASWRPDGRKIVFTSDRPTLGNPTPPGLPGPDFEVFVMNADGSNPTRITFNSLDDDGAAWSPDGKMLVIQRDLDPVRGESDYDLLTIKANGTHERNITNSPGVREVDPEWSPDGGRIAFVSNRDTDDEIYTMKPDGSRVRQLTSNTAPFDAEPNWSPDGRKIAFTSFRDATLENRSNAEIYTMRADGRDLANLTQNAAFDGAPDWQPLGDHHHDDE